MCAREGGGKNSEDREVACQANTGSWSNERQCYLSPSPDQGKAEEFASSRSSGQPGAYYTCHQVYIDGEGEPVITDSEIFWSDTPPAGVTRMTPQQAAYNLVQSFDLQGVDIGLMPDVDAGKMSAVGLPVWMWVQDPTERTWGPWTKTETIGGVTVTATATAESVAWDMGDGQIVVCRSVGTVYDGSTRPGTSSPTCGHRYSTMSPQQGRMPYPITARTNWTFEWAADGQSGTDATQTESSTQLRVVELQSVNKN